MPSELNLTVPKLALPAFPAFLNARFRPVLSEHQGHLLQFCGWVNRKRGLSGEYCEDAFLSEALRSVGVDMSGCSYAMCPLEYERVMNDHDKYNRMRIDVRERDSWKKAFTWAVERFSFLEAVQPLSNVRIREELVLDTSPGWPWNLRFQSKGEALVDARVIEYLDRYWVTGCDAASFFVVNPKEEALPLKKIGTGRGRTTVGSPLEHNYCLSRLSIPLNWQFYEQAGRTELVIGGTEFYGGRDRWMRSLEVFPYQFSADISAQDGSTAMWLRKAVLDFRLAFTPLEWRKSLTNLYTHEIFALNVDPNGCVYRKFGGNNSGQSNTMADNSIATLLVFYYSFISACGGFHGLEFFLRNVKALIYGDNLRFSVSADIVVWFNARTVFRGFWDCGYMLGFESYDARPTTDLTFLSAQDVLLFGCYVAKRNADRMLCTIAYKARPGDDVIQSMRRLASIRMAYWTNTEARIICEGMWRWMWQRHKALLLPASGELAAMWFSDRAMLGLLLGVES